MTADYDFGPERPSGPAAAALVATGIGALCLGIVTTWAEASEGFKDALQWNDRVGPLSGKTIVSVIAFAASWLVLTVWWRRKEVPLRTAFTVALVLVALGLLGTFPTFFELFAPD